MAKKSNGTFKDPRKAVAPPSPCKDAHHTLMNADMKKKKMIPKGM